MQRIILTRPDARPRRVSPWILAAAGLVVPLCALVVWAVLRPSPPRAPKSVPAQPMPPPRPTLPWKDLRPPTERKLAPVEDMESTFQPTASGRTESALFGSVRMSERGSRAMSSFHEGIDIAPVARDRKGEPADKVMAVAPGSVVYVNHIAGNSNYGKYVVLTHRDPIGAVFTLYAHLAEIDPGVKPGAPVLPGTVLGLMGHTSSTGIPRERAHVHLEVGLMSNARFAEWYRAQRLVPDHGMYHGQNFVGVDPLAFYMAQYVNPGIHFGKFLAGLPAAFEVVVRVEKPLDFFQRYQALWHGKLEGGAIVIACAQNGLPLSGRPATAAEAGALGNASSLVQNVSEEALGRNGCHLVAGEGQRYAITGSGRIWLEVLTYGSGWSGTRPAASRVHVPSRSRRR